MPPRIDTTFAVGDFFAYLKRVKAHGTAQKYEASAKHFLNFIDEKKIPFDRLPPNTLDQFVAWLLARDFAPRSVHVYLAGAKAYLRWCEGNGMAPVRLHADTPRAADPVPNALRGEAVLAFLREASKLQEPYRTALLILPYCGLRSRELCDLSLSRSVSKVALPVRGTGGHKDHLVFVIVGKGGVRRVVPILLDGVPLFLSYLREWRGKHGGPSDWVFPASGGEQIADRTLRYYCQMISDRMPQNIKTKITPHSLRDTYATALWKAGVDTITITRAVGHRSIDTTNNHYLDLQAADVAGVIQQRGARLVALPQTQAQAQNALHYLKNKN